MAHCFWPVGGAGDGLDERARVLDPTARFIAGLIVLPLGQLPINSGFMHQENANKEATLRALPYF